MHRAVAAATRGAGTGAACNGSNGESGIGATMPPTTHHLTDVELTIEEVRALLSLVRHRRTDLTQNLRRLDEADASDASKSQALRAMGPEQELFDDLAMKLEGAERELERG